MLIIVYGTVICDFVYVCLLFFFFQAEDGIRDLVRSRGLGDVYKRQPLVLPWATLNFGLHSLLSFLPFVFLYYLTQYQSKYSKFLLCGIITGLSLSLSYNSMIFIPAFIVYTFFTLTDIKKSLICISKYLVFTFLTLIPHLAARYFLDSGFNLQDDPVFSIRGLTAEGTMSGEQLSNFIVSWHRVLPASFLLSSISFISTYLQRDLVFVFFMITVVLISVRFRNNNTAIYSALLLVFLYLLFYALSPFYADEIDMKSYVYYRHITYICLLYTSDAADERSSVDLGGRRIIKKKQKKEQKKKKKK